jgi:hypothetical protein
VADDQFKYLFQLLRRFVVSVGDVLIQESKLTCGFTVAGGIVVVYDWSEQNSIQKPPIFS